MAETKVLYSIYFCKKISRKAQGYINVKILLCRYPRHYVCPKTVNGITILGFVASGSFYTVFTKVTHQ